MIEKIETDKKRYLTLLLLADEQEDMIDKYLERGDMFALIEDEVKAVCVVTDEGGGVCELQNLAVTPSAQRKGYGKRLVGFLCEEYKDRFHTMTVGTGDSPMTLSFYQACGFRESHRVKDYITQHYDHPIYENGVLLTDKVYLSKQL